jgi:CpeT protein
MTNLHHSEARGRVIVRAIVCGSAFLIATGAVRADGGNLLDDYLRLQVGTFNSAAQAARDPAYGDATWYIAEIWTGRGTGERWIYSESWMKDAPAPYMQRVSRLTVDGGSIVARRYSIAEAARFVGAWHDRGRIATLEAADLTEMVGCDAVITRAGAGRFEGGTVGDHCRNSYKGATYAISRLVLTADGMVNWDRGFDAEGDLRWGPASGGYELRRVTAPVTGDASTPDDPR